MSDSRGGDHRFVHEYFVDEDRDLYYEVDDAGFVVRNIDVGRATGEPASAVARLEWSDARDHGDLHAYIARFGRIVEGNIGETLDRPEPFEVIPGHVFEEAWSRARAKLEKRWEAGGRAAYENAGDTNPRWTPPKGPSSEP